MERTGNLRESGFVVLRNVFSGDELEPLRVLNNQIVKHAEKGLEDPFSKYSLSHRPDQGALYDLYQRHPEFRFLADRNEIIDEVETVLGANVFLYDNSLLYKPAGAENEVPWHQDFISRPKEPLKVIAWMPLDDTDEENGALKVIPGSHKKGHQSWYRVKGETHHDRISKDFVAAHEGDAIYLEMKSGDVLLFNMLLVHGSDKTNTTRPRRAFRCSYQSMDERIFSPRQSPIVIRGGAPAFLETAYPRLKEVKRNSLTHKLSRRLGKALLQYADD